MNLHRLELFYHVAKHGGISRAAQRMPYGIQQPAISEQVGALEEELGVRLFQRQPFRLTPDGAEMFALLEPFFAQIGSLETRLSGGGCPQVRIAAAEIIIEQHLPPVIDHLARVSPGIRIALRSAPCVEMCDWLREREVDLVIATLGGPAPAGFASRSVLTLPLVLLVPQASAIRSAAHLWTRAEIIEPLICPSPSEGVGHVFQKSLQQAGVRWRTTLEASSVATVTSYVAHGSGVGVSVNFPSLVEHPGVRVLELKGFESVEITLLWRPGDTARLRSLVETLASRAQLLVASKGGENKLQAPRSKLRGRSNA